MALVPPLLQALGGALADAGAAGCASRKLLSLGYPDIIATTEVIAGIFGDRVASGLKYRDDSAAIMQWHGGDRSSRVADAASLFSLLGYELEAIDVAAARGGEIIHDLNEPVAAELEERYAAVIDAGTLEHCFNIGQAVSNVARMTARGGAVLHLNPLNMYNHGFYNFSPTWYHDFYEANGFAVERLDIVWAAGEAHSATPAPPFARFQRAPDTSMLLAVARRREVRDIRWPIQKKYRDAPTLGT